MRRVTFPAVFLGLRPFIRSTSFEVPETFAPRGRWKSGPMHTFVDDYRQEFFWRRPSDGLFVALAARIVTAPDFTIYTDDPPEWRQYQAWRSCLNGSPRVTEQASKLRHLIELERSRRDKA